MYLTDKAKERLAYLYCRWEDEKRYEDWDGYADAIYECVMECLPKGTSSIKPKEGRFTMRFFDSCDRICLIGIVDVTMTEDGGEFIFQN